MTRYKKLQKMAAMAATVSMIISTCTPTFAKPSIGGGGGGRPAGGARPAGGGGGGMARPAPSAGMSRPSMNMPAARPSTPSMGNAVARPAPANHMNTPSPSVNRPSLGGGGNVAPTTRPSPNPGGVATTRPAPQPGGGQQPSIKPPSNVKPTTRPSPGGIFGEGSGAAGGNTRPNIERPSGGRPDGNRPDFGKPDVTRPTGTKPDFTRPDGTRPGGGGGGVNTGDRPSFGNLTKPAIDRPDNSRPNVGRPDGNRPDIAKPDNTRPNVGRPDGIRPETRPAPVKPERPMIGGNRPHVGDTHQFLDSNHTNIGNNITQNNITQNNITNNWGNNVNIGNNFTNRPNWDRPYYNRPNWGWGSNNWNDHWHSNCINPHYNWYNGCWNGYWNSGWYSPVAWGAVGWGLGVWTTRWSSYTPVYYNPYYVANTATTPYNYSQPVVVNNYVSADGGNSAPAAAGQPPANQQPAPQPPAPAASPGLAKFDDGLAAFKEGQYESALANFDAALKLLPSDPVVHEVRALDLFALGNYSGAAASLNSLLTAAPGMDWTTMSSLYGDTEDYVAQLRKLEKHCQAEPTDAAAAFVLAYHYLVTGAKEEAIHALRAVVKNQPKDATAKRMLDALAPPAEVEPPKPGETQVAGKEPSAEKEPAEGKDEAETDLVGTWIAKADGAEIQLTITEDSTFTWKASQKDQAAIELSGDLNATGDAIVLESKSQGSMSGNVISKGADQWQFRLAGSPAKDPGLLFARAK
ncbi:MAG: tetratricopeptide repeat protein [Planctomycetota bacterium]